MNRFKYPGLFDVSRKEKKTCMLTLGDFVGVFLWFYFFWGGGPITLSDNQFLQCLKKCLNISENMNNANIFCYRYTFVYIVYVLAKTLLCILQVWPRIQVKILKTLNTYPILSKNNFNPLQFYLYNILRKKKKTFDSTFKKTRDQKSLLCLSIIVRISSPRRVLTINE